MKKLRLFSLVLAIFAFLYFCCGPLTSNAAAVFVADDAIIAIVIAALAAMGISFAFTGGYYTLYDWIQQTILASGADFTGLSAGVNNRGNILLNNRFVIAVSTVAMYIKLHYNLDSSGHYQINQSSYGCVDELTGDVYMPGTYTSNSNYTTGTVLFEMNKDEVSGTVKNYYYRFSGTYYKVTVEYTARTQGSTPYMDFSVDLYNSTDNVDYDLLGDFVISTAQNANGRNQKIMLLLDNNEIWFCMETKTNQYGTVAGIHKLAKVVGVTIGNDLAINTEVLNIPDDSEIGSKGGKLTLPVPWGSTFPEAIDEIPDLAVEEDLIGNTTLELEDEGTIADELDTDLTNSDSVSAEAADYQSLGLQDVFPFCIPFDVYNFLDCLAAEPEAPHFAWRFYVPGICDETIYIDLAAFDTVASILRTIELLAFAAGLAFVTREKYIRG